MICNLSLATLRKTVNYLTVLREDFNKQASDSDKTIQDLDDVIGIYQEFGAEAIMTGEE